jgi:hypothetical protein
MNSYTMDVGYQDGNKYQLLTLKIKSDVLTRFST